MKVNATARLVPVATVMLAFLAAIGVAWSWSNGAELGMPLGWLLACSAAITSAMFAARSPLVPILAYIALAYGAPRYLGGLELLLRSNALDWVCSLAVLGWAAQFAASGRYPPWRHPLFFVTVVLFAWVGVSWTATTMAGPDLPPFALHHPKIFLHGFALFLVASTSLATERASWFAAATLSAAVLLCLALQGLSRLHLTSDLSFVSAVVLPLALLGSWHAKNRVQRLTLAAGAVGCVSILALAQNRAAGVGVALALLSLLRHRVMPKARLLVLGSVAAVMAAALFPLDDYFARFTALWRPEATHSTARLDRATARERLGLWSAAVKMTTDHPLLGVGPGNYAHHVDRYKPGAGRIPAHNNFAAMAAETGLPGLVLYVIVFFGALIVLELQIRRSAGAWPAPGSRALQAALVAYLGAGFFITRHDMPLAYLFVGWAIALAAAPTEPVRTAACHA